MTLEKIVASVDKLTTTTLRFVVKVLDHVSNNCTLIVFLRFENDYINTNSDC